MLPVRVSRRGPDRLGTLSRNLTLLDKLVNHSCGRYEADGIAELQANIGYSRSPQAIQRSLLTVSALPGWYVTEDNISKSGCGWLVWGCC